MAVLAISRIPVETIPRSEGARIGTDLLDSADH